MPEPKTLSITNFGGPLTRRDDGDINSGKAKFNVSWGYDPYSKPGNLTWFEQPTSILTLTTNNGPTVAMKTRSEGSNNYVYTIVGGGTTRLRRIQVNQSGSNINYDSPSILGTVSAVLDVTKSAGIIFYGSTEKIFVGTDTGVAKINFDGSGASVIGTTASIAGAMVEFLGKIYFSCGNNIGEIDSTETITTTAKLSPALPVSLKINDLDLTPDGNYLQITASELEQPNRLDGQVNPEIAANSVNSFKFYWNGVDGGITSLEKFGGLGLIASEAFGNKNYGFGYDSSGSAVFDGPRKTITLLRNFVPHRGATFSTNNVLGFACPEYDTANSELSTAIYHYGQYDDESPAGLFRLLRQSAQVRDDVVSIPACLNVSNLLYTSSVYGMANNIGGAPKLYYSTVEESNSSTNRLHKLWRFPTYPTNGSILAGVYETPTQLFSKKVAIKEVRLYTDPLAANNAFEIDLIGSGGSVLSGGSRGFAVGTNVTAGEDLVRYNPATAPTYALGVRITNASVTGTRNWTATKLEIDYGPAGK